MFKLHFDVPFYKLIDYSIKNYKGKPKDIQYIVEMRFLRQ